MGIVGIAYNRASTIGLCREAWVKQGCQGGIRGRPFKAITQLLGNFWGLGALWGTNTLLAIDALGLYAWVYANLFGISFTGRFFGDFYARAYTRIVLVLLARVNVLLFVWGLFLFGQY